LGAIYFPHAAFSDLACDLVMPERIADHEETSSTSTAGSMQKSGSRWCLL
jgi:hypothetical protein